MENSEKQTSLIIHDPVHDGNNSLRKVL